MQPGGGKLLIRKLSADASDTADEVGLSRTAIIQGENMSSVNRYDVNYRNQIDQSLNQTSEQAKTGAAIAETFADLESQLITVYSKLGNEADATKAKALEADAHVLEQKYRRASRVYEAFQQILKNADETMRRAISNLSIR